MYKWIKSCFLDDIQLTKPGEERTEQQWSSYQIYASGRKVIDRRDPYKGTCGFAEPKLCAAKAELENYIGQMCCEPTQVNLSSSPIFKHPTCVWNISSSQDLIII